MKNKRLVSGTSFFLNLCLLLLAAVSSCTSNPADEELIEASIPISFVAGWEAASNWNTKVTGMDGVHISNFSLNAVTTGSAFDFMDNTVVVRNLQSNIWSYSPLKYFPPDGTSVRFYAYSPAGSVHVRGITTVSGSTASITYRVPLNNPNVPIESIQEDFLVASATGNKNLGTTLTLNFEHALAHLSFKATNNTAGVILITAIELLYLDREGRVTLPFVGTWIDNFDYNSTYQVSIPSSGVLIASGESAVIGSATDGLVILPQDLTTRKHGNGIGTEPDGNGEPEDAGPEPGLGEAASYLAVTYFVGGTKRVKYISLHEMNFVNKKYNILFSLY